MPNNKSTLTEDLYYDDPYEGMCFRIDHATLKYYSKFYGKPESPANPESDLTRDAIRGDVRLSKEEYEAK